MLEGWFVPHPQSRGVIVMFTGYAGVKDGLLTPAATVFQLGYSSFLVDFRGTGGSSGSDTTMGLREAEDVAAAVAYARENWPGQPIVIYGVSIRVAAYVQLGPLIVCYGRMTWSAATGTGLALARILPFPSNSTEGLRVPATLWISSFTYAGSWVEFLIPEGTTDAIIYTVTSNATVTSLNVEASVDMAWSVAYFI